MILQQEGSMEEVTFSKCMHISSITIYQILRRNYKYFNIVKKPTNKAGKKKKDKHETHEVWESRSKNGLFKFG